MLTTTLLDTGWQFIETKNEGEKVGFSNGEWLPAHVPGHVHRDLVENGVIGDPFYRMNELGCQWVDEADWSYRTTFSWTAKDGQPMRVLRFEGLDTVCTIKLNGEEIGRSDNMFTPLEIDVSDRLREGENELRVDFESAARVGRERQAAYFEKEGLEPEKVGRFGERAFVRKAQYMYGWDWGPRLVSCGIWKPVSLIEFNSRIVDVHITRDGQDRYVLKTEFEGEGTVEHVLLREGEDVERIVGDGTFEAEGTPWRVRASGGNYLDEVWTTLTDADGAYLDMKSTTCAVSSIRLVRQPDEHGESFEFEVDGKPLWARGANWIPDHSLPGTVTKTQLRDRLQKALDMGMNMLRVWGGGLYESDEFYDLCDEMGILVWQDFPFACGFYPDTDEYVEPFRREATANVRRLRNHPCLALWCGNNENHQCFADRWMGDKTPPRFYGEHFYHGVIPEVLAELDPHASYIPGSACGPVDDPLTKVNEGGFGDSHYWDVWHGRGDWKHYADSTARFSSEFGFASSPSLETWKSCLADEDWSVRSPAVRWHDKTGKGYETFIGYVKLHYPEPQTLEDWTYFSQLNQRDALRFGIEHYRRSEFCKGTLVWQLNDCWPVQSWAVMDSLGRIKPAGYELARVYADQLLSLVRKGEMVELWAVNDGPEPHEFEANLVAVHAQTGEGLRARFETVRLAPGERRKVLEESVAGLPAPETLVMAHAGELQAWLLATEPKDARLTPWPLTATVDDGLLTVEADGPVVDLWLREEGTTRIPFKLWGNGLTFNGSESIPCDGLPGKLHARSLAGEHPVRVVCR